MIIEFPLLYELFQMFSESFDVYNIETALPKLDLDAIESHLKAAKEAERRVSCKIITCTFI